MEIIPTEDSYLVMPSRTNQFLSSMQLAACLQDGRDQGRVVQSVVSLTSSLRAISLTILADSIYNFLKFFVEKM